MSFTGYNQSAACVAPVEERIAFIRKTYLHLTGAVILFTLISALFYMANVGATMLSFLSGSTFGWIILMLVFVGGASVAQGMAAKGGSSGTAYLGLGLFAVLEAVVGMIFGLNLGVWYSAAVILIACGFILYDTSNVVRKYPTDQYVFAALQLFSSLALLFMYVIRLLMETQRR
jgi:FtsH-binding integral membrane protein